MENQVKGLTKINKDLETKEKLEALRSLMSIDGLDGYIVRTTDKYLNEYIPQDYNSRFYLSGFTGSVGDMFITASNAYLIVDGRYYLQAPQEVDENYITIIKQPGGILADKILIDLILEAASQSVHFTLGMDGDKNTVSHWKKITDDLIGKNITLQILTKDLVEEIRPLPYKTPVNLVPVQSSLAGLTNKEKYQRLQRFLTKQLIDALLVTKLESLAYCLNLRGYEIPYSSTFRGSALITATNVYLFTDNIIPPFLEAEIPIHQYPEDSFQEVVQTLVEKGVFHSVGVIAAETMINTQQILASCNVTIVELSENLLRDMRCIKNHGELKAFQDSFKRSDIAFIRTIQWIQQSIVSGVGITERDVADKIVEEFYNQGAVGLSFNPIVGFGSNSAIIHYGTPSKTHSITPGNILLIDAGAYYEGGYATDLTRTLFIGDYNTSPTAEQKRLYSTVLKASLAGIHAPIRSDTTGYDIDQIVRAMNHEFNGFTYGHGTGHGIGINVHEFPPSISNGEAAKKYPLQEGMVFTIEPGLYKEGYGGVRIENVVTISKEGENLALQQLTFAPLEAKLIDSSMFSSLELEWLKAFEQEVQKRYADYL